MMVAPPTHAQISMQCPVGAIDGRRLNRLAHEAFALSGPAFRNPIPNAERLGLNPAFRCVKRGETRRVGRSS
jgi:hypothetical protein